MKMISRNYAVLLLLAFLTFYQTAIPGKVILNSNISYTYEQNSLKEIYLEDIRYISTARKRSSYFSSLLIILPAIFLSIIPVLMLKLSTKFFNYNIIFDNRKKIRNFTLMYFNCGNYKKSSFLFC